LLIKRVTLSPTFVLLILLKAIDELLTLNPAASYTSLANSGLESNSSSTPGLT